MLFPKLIGARVSDLFQALRVFYICLSHVLVLHSNHLVSGQVIRPLWIASRSCHNQSLPPLVFSE